MRTGRCERCGAEDSMFWYPYAFGVAPIPSVTDRCVDRCQYFQLCDSCQAAFVDFMKMKIDNPYFDTKKLKELMDSEPMEFVPEVKE